MEATATKSTLFGPFWNIFATLFAFHLMLLALEKLGLIKSKSK